MEISTTLRRPANWQDFETLCKKLWGEIWNCSEIKKNGRLGQTQNGVDIYGIPIGESDYYGIQCKGKDEYSDKQFTEDEITNEIEKAKLFNPKLKKLYFATTAVKDVKIEEFIRQKNLDNIKNGLFEIHIFSWEDIVELIDENKQTHDYYVNSQNYKSKQSVTVTFQNGSTELVVSPQFQKTITHFRQKAIPVAMTNLLKNMAIPQAFYQQQFKNIAIAHIVPPSTKINKSLCKIYFQIHNTGSDPLEDYKMFFCLEGDVQEITKDNEINSGSGILASLSKINHFSDVNLSKKENCGKVIPHNNNILVSDDVFYSDSFYIKPFPKNYEIKVLWKLISKNFKTEGELKIIVEANIDKEYKEILVEDSSKVKIEEGEVEDVFVEKKQEGK
jgi:hypothetical protein